jgi:hypothetical protein
MRIEYLGMAPIIADAFLIAALGFWGLAAYSHTNRNSDRINGDRLRPAQVMAQGSGMHLALARGRAEIKAGQ